MDEIKRPQRFSNDDRQKFVGAVNTIISKMEQANKHGGFTLKESMDMVQAISNVTTLVNGPLQSGSLDSNERQRLMTGVGVMCSTLETANKYGGFSLKDSAEVAQNISIAQQFVNGL